jgi:hypothetical protein
MRFVNIFCDKVQCDNLLIRMNFVGSLMVQNLENIYYHPLVHIHIEFGF